MKRNIATELMAVNFTSDSITTIKDDQTTGLVVSERVEITTDAYGKLGTQYTTSKESSIDSTFSKSVTALNKEMITAKSNSSTSTFNTKTSSYKVEDHTMVNEHVPTTRVIGNSSTKLNFTSNEPGIDNVVTTNSRPKSVVTSSISAMTNSTVITGSITATTSSNTVMSDSNAVTTSSNVGCSSSIVMISSIAAALVLFVILTAILYVVRMKRKWRRKLREERLKTDIWTMSTYNNTIVNENFADYTLAPTPMPERKNAGTKFKKNSKTSKRSSTNSRELIHSWYTDSSSGASIRRNTFSEPNSIGKRKIRTPRQVSEYSGDYRFEDGPYERGRTSTFSVGWNVKMRDKNALMNHEEPIDKSTDDFRTLNFYSSSPTNEHIFTEL